MQGEKEKRKGNKLQYNDNAIELSTINMSTTT